MGYVNCITKENFICFNLVILKWVPEKGEITRYEGNLRSDEDVRQKEKGTIEDETVGWHHRLNGHELEQALGDGEGQGSLTDYAKAFDSVDHNKLWKILQETGTPDHLTCLLRNLSAGQEATVRT